MKKTPSLLCLVLAILFVPLITTHAASKTKVLPFSRKNSRPTFAVLADTHLGSSASFEKMDKAIDHLLAKEKNLDALFILGDITESGSVEEYQAVQRFFDHKLPSTLDVHYVMGNRERTNDNQTTNEQSQFEKVFRQKPNRYFELKGYPFIVLNVQSQSAPYYGENELIFLVQSLGELSKRYPKKPITIMCHVPAENTVYGSRIDEGWGSNELSQILKNYPQAVVFSGHSHYSLADERSIHQKHFTAINVGAISFTELEKGYSHGTRPPHYTQVAEIAIAEVLKNQNIEIRRLDALRGDYIKQPWLIKAPFQQKSFSYNKLSDHKKPEFPIDSTIELISITDHQCEIRFPQATDNDLVHHYVIDILANDQVYQRYTTVSQFYLNREMPQHLEWKATGLQDDTDYKVRIIALDSFGNASQPLSSEYFRTPPYLPSSTFEAPHADLLDVVFNDYTAVDQSRTDHKITYQGGAPNTRFDSHLNCYVADFQGDANSFYKVPHLLTAQKLKEVLQTGFSIEIYFKSSDALPSTPMGSINQGGFGITQDKGGQPRFCMNTPQETFKVGNYMPRIEEYNHYIFSYDGREMHSYTNGIPTGTTPTSGAPELPADQRAHWFAIGGDAHTSNTVKNPFAGSIALVRIYSHAICRDEAFHLYRLMDTRMKLQNMEDFNQLLTSTIPRRIAESINKDRKERLSTFILEGWKLMLKQTATQEEINRFMHEAKMAF